MTIIMLNGYAGVGKDTVAAHLERAHGFRRYAIADGLREFLEKQNPGLYTDRDATTVTLDRALRAYGGWGNLKRDASTGVRILMESTGQAARDVLGENVWVDACTRRMADDIGYRWWGRESRIVVSDVRHENERDAFRYLCEVSRFGLQTPLVRVERPGWVPVSWHISAGVLSCPDHTIVNDGTIDDLKVKVDKLVEVLS